MQQPIKKKQTTTTIKPELSGNQTVWKSNNQAVKEETFVQTGRRSRDRQPSAEQTVPHSCEDKTGGAAGEQDR